MRTTSRYELSAASIPGHSWPPEDECCGPEGEMGRHTSESTATTLVSATRPASLNRCPSPLPGSRCPLWSSYDCSSCQGLFKTRYQHAVRFYPHWIPFNICPSHLEWNSLLWLPSLPGHSTPATPQPHGFCAEDGDWLVLFAWDILALALKAPHSGNLLSPRQTHPSDVLIPDPGCSVIRRVADELDASTVAWSRGGGAPTALRTPKEEPAHLPQSPASGRSRPRA